LTAIKALHLVKAFERAYVGTRYAIAKRAPG